MSIEQPASQEQLVTGLAHRMNNILTLFHGYVGLLLDNNSLDKGTRASLAKIKDGACAATELIDRTHSLVRQSKVIMRELDLAQFLTLLRPSLQTLCAPATTLTLTTPALPVVRTDAGRVKAALTELVRNAADATVDGGTIRVEVGFDTAPGHTRVGGRELTSGAGDWISISVIDDGHGIAPEVAARMFQPFYSTRKQHQATGLGLNVAADAVQQLGGVLSHSSGAGETRFAILLPVRTTA
jgi:two-component system cell cycle sensor histidine kinase/response regulator CckA